eukprot:1009922-Rhodomonas_salina.1
MEAVFADTFVGLSSLRKLVLDDVSQVGLRFLFRGAFNCLPHLQSLSIRNSRLQAIFDGAFHGLSELQHLDLRGNLISSLSWGASVDLVNLELLRLSGNPLFCSPVLPPKLQSWDVREQVEGLQTCLVEGCNAHVGARLVAVDDLDLEIDFNMVQSVLALVRSDVRSTMDQTSIDVGLYTAVGDQLCWCLHTQKCFTLGALPETEPEGAPS